MIDAGLRALGLLVLGLLIAALAGALLARRMVVPIRAMQAGAERIGSGELGHRLSIKTGDELESLANQFNRSAAALEESYATLEQRVEDRTRELDGIARAADRDGRDPARHLPVADRRAAGAGRRGRRRPPLLRRDRRS